MSSSAINAHHGAAAHGHDHDHHQEEANSRTLYGFWIYLMSDCLLFSGLFATFAVLMHATAGAKDGHDLFDLKYVFGETMLLLLSSVTFGYAMLSMHAGQKSKVIAWLVITWIFGAGFVGMEIYEFTKLVLVEHAGPDHSAFLSAYFTLVGTHGIHVSSGLLWILVMMFQVGKFGLTSNIQRRLSCLSLFWHFLDLVWICVFSFVYLFGVL